MGLQSLRRYAGPRRLRAFVRSRGQHADPRLIPWPVNRKNFDSDTPCACNICGWRGDAFASGFHSEGALCPSCGSIARDRFLYWCWTHRTTYSPTSRVLETSPRLDERYRNAMAGRVKYTASDYDQSAHRAMIKLDLQEMSLPDRSVDVLLTPHVLEHVPDTQRSLAEIFRVLAPGGHMFLLIPMPQAVTAPPVEPEYHGDQTLVFWRFGWDLRDQLLAAGFTVETLVGSDLIDRVTTGRFDSNYGGDDCDEVGLLSAADAALLTPVADSAQAHRFGFLPDFMFICWHCVRPSDVGAGDVQPAGVTGSEAPTD
jgi:SAM-dependent methyltransferase